VLGPRSIRRAADWLFGLGDGREAAAFEPSRRSDDPPGESAEVRLYGEAEAIRVLYQRAFIEVGPPKPPRPRGRRGLWIARCLSSLSPALRAPAGSQA
jgi:hypothetical protein